MHINWCTSYVVNDIAKVNTLQRTWQVWANVRPKMSQQNSKFHRSMEFHYYIWNHRRKCIQISTNMPSIGSECHQDFNVESFVKTKVIFCRMNEPNGRMRSVKYSSKRETKLNFVWYELIMPCSHLKHTIDLLMIKYWCCDVEVFIPN